MDNRMKDDLANRAQAVLDEAEGLDPATVPDELVAALQAAFDLAEAVLEAMSDPGKAELKSASAGVVPRQTASVDALRAAIGKRTAKT